MRDDISSNEVFKDIADFPRYQVSNLGRVKSLVHKKERILKTGLNGRGYLQVKLYKNGKKNTIKIHSLVAKTFIGESNGLDVDHIDEIKTNNKLENLFDGEIEFDGEKYDAKEVISVKALPETSIVDEDFGTEVYITIPEGAIEYKFIIQDVIDLTEIKRFCLA